MKVSLALIAAASALVPCMSFAGRSGGPATASASSTLASASGSTTIATSPFASDALLSHRDPTDSSIGDRSARTADELAVSATGVVTTTTTTSSPTSSGSAMGAAATATKVDAQAEDSFKDERSSDVPFQASAEGFSASVTTVDGGSLEGRDHGTTEAASDMEASGLRVNDSIILAVVYRNCPSFRPIRDALERHVTQSPDGVAKVDLRWCASHFLIPLLFQLECRGRLNLAILQHCHWSSQELLAAASEAQLRRVESGGSGADKILIELCEANRRHVGTAALAAPDDDGGPTSLLGTSQIGSRGEIALDNVVTHPGGSKTIEPPMSESGGSSRGRNAVAAGTYSHREKPVASNNRRRTSVIARPGPQSESSSGPLLGSPRSAVPVKQDSPGESASGAPPGPQHEASRPLVSPTAGPTSQLERATPEMPLSEGDRVNVDSTFFSMYDFEFYDDGLYQLFVGIASVLSMALALPFFVGDDPTIFVDLISIVFAVILAVAACFFPKKCLLPFLIHAIGCGHAIYAVLTFPKLRSEDRKKLVDAIAGFVVGFGAIDFVASPFWTRVCIASLMVVNGTVMKRYDWLYNQFGWRFLAVLAANAIAWLACLLAVLRQAFPTVGFYVASTIFWSSHLSVFSFLLRILLFGFGLGLGVPVELPGGTKKWVPDPVAHILGFYVPAHDGQEGRIAGNGEAVNTNAGAAEPVPPQTNPQPPPPPPPPPRPPTSASSQGPTTQQTNTEGNGTRSHPSSNQAIRAQGVATHPGNTDGRPIQAATTQQGTKDRPAPQGQGTSTGNTGISTHEASTATTQHGTKDPPAPQGQGSSTCNTANSTHEASTQPSTNDRPVVVESEWSEHKHNGRTFLYNRKTEEYQWKDEKKEETAEVPAEAVADPPDSKPDDDRTSTEAAKASNESDHDQEDSKPSANDENQDKAAGLHITDDMSGNAIANALGYGGGNASSPGSF